MPASYPSTVPTFTVKRDNLDINWAADVNRLQDETNAIAGELGTNPSGPGHATVRERLEHLQTSKSDTGHTHDDRYVRRNLATSKGDLVAASGEGSFGTLGPGNNGQALTADSGQPLGVRWKTLAHGDLTGLTTGDPHTQYLLKTEFTNVFGSHGHAAYFLAANHTKATHEALGIGHGSLEGRGASNAHPQYPRSAATEEISGAWNFTTRPTVSGDRVLSSPQARKVTVSASAPSSPSTHDLWIRI